LYADLKNLPPALFTIATKDPFIDDTYFMEARCRLVGNKTYLATYRERPHGFNVFPRKMAEAETKKSAIELLPLCEK
jgi:acetyl esterase/lipase